MGNERSRQKLLEFLDYLGEKGLVAQATVAARKASAGKVLSILSEEEAADVTKLELDQVMTRFTNLEGKAYTPVSLTSYRSRTRASLDDFKSYLKNPLGFRPNIQSRERRPPESKKVKLEAGSLESSSLVEKTFVQAPLSSSILPIQIRADVTVFVQGLPFDLTASEANKIANVIKAMATPS